MNKLEQATFTLAKSSRGNPVVSTSTILLFFLMFNLLESSIERLAFGERFEHWLDPLFTMAFISYSAYAVWWCAIFNGIAREKPTGAENASQQNDDDIPL